MSKGVGHPAYLLNQIIAKRIRCDEPEQRQTLTLLVAVQVPHVVTGEKPHCCTDLLLRKQLSEMGQMRHILKSQLVCRDSNRS